MFYFYFLNIYYTIYYAHFNVLYYLKKYACTTYNSVHIMCARVHVHTTFVILVSHDQFGLKNIPFTYSRIHVYAYMYNVVEAW